MNIIAKMVCESSVNPTGDRETIRLRAVYSDSPENKTFSEATPSAHLEMNITNKSAMGEFKEGVEYYVRFQDASA